MFWLIISFIWAAIRLIRLRRTVQLSEENEWSFGQIFAVVMLAAPVVALLSSFSPSNPGASALTSSADQPYDSSELEESRNHPIQPQTQPITRVLDTRIVDQKVNELYESGVSFQGALILAGFTYTNIATFIISSDKTSPSITYIASAQL